MTVLYAGSSKWEITLDPKKQIIMTSAEIEELVELAPEFLYEECSTKPFTKKENNGSK